MRCDSAAALACLAGGAWRWRTAAGRRRCWGGSAGQAGGSVPRSGGGAATSSQGCLDVVDDVAHVFHGSKPGGLVEALAEAADVDDADQRARLAEDADGDAGKALLELVHSGR